MPEKRTIPQSERMAFIAENLSHFDDTLDDEQATRVRFLIEGSTPIW